LNDFKLFALGGQDEKGKNLYVIEIEDSLFVFDFGIKHPEKGILGIDAVIPSIDYLIENENGLKGSLSRHLHQLMWEQSAKCSKS
jgi:ribonuclease J